jgi:hypothetical protein
VELELTPVKWHVGISLAPEIDLRKERLQGFYRALHDAHPSIFNKPVRLADGEPLVVISEPSRPLAEPTCLVTAGSVQFNLLEPTSGDRELTVAVATLLCEQAEKHFGDLERVARVGKAAELLGTVPPEHGTATDVVRRAMTRFDDADGIGAVLVRVVLREMGKNINLLVEARMPVPSSGPLPLQEEAMQQRFRVQCDINNTNVSGSVSPQEAAEIVRFADEWVDTKLEPFIMRRIQRE